MVQFDQLLLVCIAGYCIKFSFNIGHWVKLKAKLIMLSTFTKGQRPHGSQIRAYKAIVYFEICYNTNVKHLFSSDKCNTLTLSNIAIFLLYP